jgi:GT2 family glycosyltransferase
MKLSIIIVSWNVKDILSDCLDSVLRSSIAFPYEIIVVDNASTDGTAGDIKKKFPVVKIIENKENLGFAFANNQGANFSSGEYLLFLNPDTILFGDTISSLVGFMDRNPDIAMCGPRILNENRTIQKSIRNFPSWPKALYRYTILKYLGLFKSHFEKWYNRGFDYDKQADIEQLIGAAMLIRKNVFEQIGRFDERFFMYYEEVDLCRRLRDDGFRVVYYPGAQLIHLGGKSARQIPAMSRSMMLRSLLLYFRKNSSILSYIPLSVIFKIGVLPHQLYELIVFFVGFQVYRLSANSQKAAKCSVRYKSASDFLLKFYLNFLFC